MQPSSICNETLHQAQDLSSLLTGDYLPTGLDHTSPHTSPSIAGPISSSPISSSPISSGPISSSPITSSPISSGPISSSPISSSPVSSGPISSSPISSTSISSLSRQISSPSSPISLSPQSSIPTLPSASDSPTPIPPPTELEETPLSSLELFDPLYPGADITFCGGMCAIMQFCSSSKLSYTVIDKLLKLLQILCPAATELPTSFYKFKKFFEKFNPIHTHQRICLKCKSSDCSYSTIATESTAHLVHLDIQKPLEIIITRKYTSYC